MQKLGWWRKEQPRARTRPAGTAGALLHEARAKFKRGENYAALRTLDDALEAGMVAPGLHHLKGLCLNQLGRHEEALRAFESELAQNSGNEQARRWRDRLSQALAKPVREQIPSDQRPWNTSLPRATLLSIQQSLHNYTYRGVPILKNPFDLALYPLLLWRVKPRTVIEIGSKSGGSALWLGDLMSNFSTEGHVYSVDLVCVDTVTHPRVTFLAGDGRALEATLRQELLEKLPRPWLIIEDADHHYATSIAVLHFFHPWLREGEFIIIEDGIISDLEQLPDYDSGPHRAIKEFLHEHSRDYVIDGEYCDFFGYNMTWCTNGFLRRIATLEENPTSAELLQQAEQLFDRGEVRQSFTRANQLKSRRPSVRGTDLLRARCFLHQKQKTSAIEALKEELRYFPDHAQAQELLSDLIAKSDSPRLAENAEFRSLYEQVRPYTMVSPARLFSLFSLAREVCTEDLPGNFVECGVAAGGSSALLGAVIAKYTKRSRSLFACDTFEGMPATSDVDTHCGQQADLTGWGSGTCAAPVESLREVCAKLGVDQIVRPVKGLFADTLPALRAEIGPIALLHMDGDWYSSTRDILQNLFDNVVSGGRIQIDDYGYWEGCARAVKEFERERGIEFHLKGIDGTGVWMVK